MFWGAQLAILSVGFEHIAKSLESNISAKFNTIEYLLNELDTNMDELKQLQFVKAREKQALMNLSRSEYDRMIKKMEESIKNLKKKRKNNKSFNLVNL